jgi:two-component system sensor histidine kinase DesK
VAEREGWVSGWAWPDRHLFGQEDQGRGSRLPSLVWPALFLFYLVQPVIQAFAAPHSAAYRVAVVAVTVVYSLSYLMTIGVGIRGASRTFRVVSVAWLFLMPVLLAFLGGPELLVYWTYAIAAALVLLPRNVGVSAGFGSAVAVLVTSMIETGKASWDSAMLLVVMTMAMFAFIARTQTVAELRAAKDRVADLAVAEERARLSRDLHDVLGHSLTTITVKAGLARRVLESAADRDLAVAEVADIEHLSRQAMAEVRATVSGYRKGSLPAELAGARAALRAADIAADLPHAVDNVPVSLREPFAYVLREGITNVIRHSGAKRCEVRLGESWIEIVDDGVGSTVDGEVNGRHPGHGLTGLAERLAPFGGTVDAGSAGDGGFRLRATIPSGG